MPAQSHRTHNDACQDSYVGSTSGRIQQPSEGTSRARRDQPGKSLDLAGCARGELGARAYAELAVRLRKVPFDGLGAQRELPGRLGVRVAGRDKSDDPPLRL